MHLRSLVDERERLSQIKEVIETYYFSQEQHFAAESDKSWDAMHRALADTRLVRDGYPLSHAVLGGELLYSGSDHILSLKIPPQVREIAMALAAITEADFRRRYFAIDESSYGFPLSDQDFQYTWDWFQSVRELYTRAAQAGRFVLFTADQ